MVDPNVVWFKTRDQIWRKLVAWWPNRKLSPDFPKMPLAGELADEMLDMVWSWQPNEQLLIDVRRKLLAIGELHLAERVSVAIIQAQLVKGVVPTVEREPTPDWYLWLLERVWVTKPEHNPKHLALRLRILADQVERRAKGEGYRFDNQMTIEFEDPARPF